MTLLDIPVDEDSPVRHYTLTPTDLLEIQLRRREHNQLGFAVQLDAFSWPTAVGQRNSAEGHA
ncbi:MAG: DUF4158 domain-containing protein [Rhizobiaceae bacterium]|nr:MAG: DUF4158 domain-containing protein [Rhizobiaceae bacterium]